MPMVDDGCGGGSHTVASSAAPPRPNLRASAWRALDLLNRGVVLMDDGRRPGYMNGSARAVFARRSPLALRQGRVVLTNTADDARLERYLASPLQPQTHRESLALQLNGATPGHGHQVLVNALDDSPDHSTYCLFIQETIGRVHRMPAMLLRDLHGLTPAEARLASELYERGSLAAAATSLRITLNTARSTLKRVFAKCGVNSQAGLLQMLSLGLAAW